MCKCFLSCQVLPSCQVFSFCKLSHGVKGKKERYVLLLMFMFCCFCLCSILCTLPYTPSDTFARPPHDPHRPLTTPLPHQVLQASRSRSLRNFDFRPITFPLHDPPSFQPAPLSAAYTWNKVDQDAEEVSVGGEGHPAPDLSRDTAVNFFPPDRQGMVMVEPDAEVFDLNSVVEKSNDLEFS